MMEFLQESFVYLIIAGLIQWIATPIVVGLISIYTKVKLSLKRVLAFNMWLLFWGCLGHYIWHVITYSNFYTSMDRLVDWLPFIPFSYWDINREWSGEKGSLLNGATMIQLQGIWLLIALPVWILTFASYIFGITFIKSVRNYWINGSSKCTQCVKGSHSS